MGSEADRFQSDQCWLGVYCIPVIGLNRVFKGLVGLLILRNLACSFYPSFKVIIGWLTFSYVDLRTDRLA